MPAILRAKYFLHVTILGYHGDAASLTGLVMALGTPSGLFRHYWVLITFVLTIFTIVVLLLHMPAVSATANSARRADGAVLFGLSGLPHKFGDE